jgi:hypothetical protein
LRRSGEPQQFVKVAPLRVLFPLEYRGVFFRRDRPFFFEHGFWPLQSRNDRFEQPFHAQGVIVNAPQINIDGHLAVGQCLVKMFWSGSRAHAR